MPLIQWTDSMSVENPEIDKQHKMLVEKTNEFYDACLKGKGKDIVGDAVAFLEDYAKKHFNYEEAYFKSKNFPKAPQHCEMHKQFVAKVAEVKKKLEAEGASSAMAIEIARFVAQWLSSHIKGADHSYCEYIKTGKCPV